MFQVEAFHHASLVVKDTATALAFYQDILGLELVQSRPDLGFPGAWLEVGTQQLHLLELPDPDALSQRPEHGGRDRHLAFHVKDLTELESRLQLNGIIYTKSRSGRNALFCRDPDKNALEFIEI